MSPQDEKQTLINWIVAWRQQRRGPVEPGKHRRMLQKCTVAELARVKQDIRMMGNVPRNER